MKKVRFAVMIIIVLCSSLLAGCVRMNIGITFKANGKLDAELVTAISSELYAEGESALDDEELANFESDEWDIKEYSSDGYVGYSLKKKNIDIKELISDLDADESDFSFRKDGLRYILDWDMGSEMDGIGILASTITGTGGYVKMTINLPVKAIEHNATNEFNNGKTLEWDLLQTNNIHLVFSLFSIWIIVILAVVIVIVLIIIIISSVHNHKKKKPQNALDFLSGIS